MSNIYFQAITPWPNIRIQHALPDTHRDVHLLIARYQRYTHRILWRYGELTDRRRHGVLMQSGVTKDGDYLVLAKRKRNGYRPRMVYRLFHGPELEPLLKQAKEWTKVRVTKSRPRLAAQIETPFRVLCGNPSAYFENKRLPAGITVRPLTIPNTYSVTLIAQGRTICSERLRHEQVWAYVEYLKTLKSSL